MMNRKTPFTLFTLALFEVCAVYALFCGITDLADAKTYPFLRYGAAILLFAAMLSLAHLAKCVPWKKLASFWAGQESWAVAALRGLLIAVLLLTSAILRIWVIRALPIVPSSDYQTYYQVAELLAKGGLASSGYAGYIAQFPHVIGYPFVLSLLFRLTGPSLQAGLCLNLAACLCSVILVYRIARALGGRGTGIVALLAAAFWPSQILYGAILGSEPVFVCMLLTCARLFIYLYQYPVKLENREGAMYVCVALGVALGLTNAIRPLATIFLIATALCLAPSVKRFDKSEQMLNGWLSRISCQGWFLALLVAASFFITTSLINAWIADVIGYELPGSGVSFGYNLMVGLNIEAKGAWNQMDAEFFGAEFAATNSAVAAHKASLGIAMERLRNDPPVGLLNLAMEKFSHLWKNDDYGATWTALFLEQQGDLSPARQSIINVLAQWNDGFYLLSLFFSAVYAARLFRRPTQSPAQVFVLLFVGVAALHMIVESQNRYHYLMLPVFAILAALAVADIINDRPGAGGSLNE
ncbi:MAG: glycosyltransferase family 39 protein [Candidatus Pelethousia sp.]|nr:glycosyltransferase family 39 protein [Candidatus Pelethousia sp.]